VAAAGNGVYEVSAAGFVELTNPIAQQWKINGRLGADSEILLGASTEASDGSFDMFVALKAPAAGVTNGLLNGSYSGGSLWFPNGRDTAVKTALLLLTPNGGGVFPGSRVIGHAADAGETTVEQALTNATYALNGDGSGTASFGASASLFSGNHDVFVSANGNYFIGYSTEPGGREIFLAIKSFSNAANNASWEGNYWIAEVFADLKENSYSMGSGAIGPNGLGVAPISERFRVEQSIIDFSGVNGYAIRPDSTGTLAGTVVQEIVNLAIGAPRGERPGAFVQAQVEELTRTTETHGLAFGVRMPDLSGPGVFLSPLGVVNGASSAPPTYPISGGTILSLYGTSLAPVDQQIASQVPLPKNMAGVTVTINGVPAPLFFISPTQINLQAPFSISGETAKIVVNNNSFLSNEVEVPVAATSPGVFSVNQKGIGPGVITHADFSLVTAQDPALPGEPVIIFLTGLGALDPPVADGAAGPADPLSFVSDPGLMVEFGGEAGTVLFAGAAPFFVGLYQLNVTIPETVFVGPSVFVSIITSNGFSDLVDIAIGL